MNIMMFMAEAAAAEESMKMNDSGFTPVETQEVEATKNCISKEAATDIVKKYLSIPEGYKQRSANLYEDYDNPDQKVWNIDWKKPMMRRRRWIDICPGPCYKLLNF
jgi:hypothetical protein